MQHGELGVYAFFVVSGFIIPYSMWNSGYQLKDIGVFWAKRVIRLHPTFLVALLATVFLSVLASKIKGEPINFSLSDIAKFSFYVGFPPENPVIWSLIVELKYYTFVSLLFPLFYSQNARIRITVFLIAVLGSIALRSIVPDLKYLPYFLLGFTACYSATKTTNRPESILYLILSLAACLNSAVTHLLTGLLTFMIIIRKPEVKFKTLGFLGLISYSLYLIHFPVGVKFLNLFLPKVDTAWAVSLLVPAVFISILAAYFMFLIVERPTNQWSSKIKYRKNEPNQ